MTFGGETQVWSQSAVSGPPGLVSGRRVCPCNEDSSVRVLRLITSKRALGSCADCFCRDGTDVRPSAYPSVVLCSVLRNGFCVRIKCRRGVDDGGASDLITSARLVSIH